jgi:hypothetical protein
MDEQVRQQFKGRKWKKLGEEMDGKVKVGGWDYDYVCLSRRGMPPGCLRRIMCVCPAVVWVFGIVEGSFPLLSMVIFAIIRHTRSLVHGSGWRGKEEQMTLT